MHIIVSKLENNIFSGILIKKGENKISDKDYKTLLLDVNFVTFVGLKYLSVQGQIFPKVTKAVEEIKDKKLDFENMTQPELKSYVIKNNIKVPSFKKVDILAALKQVEEEGENK